MILKKISLLVLLLFSVASVFSQNIEEKKKLLIPLGAGENRIKINSINIQADKTIDNKFQSVDFTSFSKIMKDTSVIVKYSKSTNLPISIETPREIILLSNKIKSYSVMDTNKVKIKSNTEISNLSFDYFKELQPITGNLDPQNNLELLKVDLDEKGNYHNLFQQKYKGIKIYGNEVVTHLNSKGQGFLFNGKYDLNLDNIDTNPAISIDSAFKIIIESEGQLQFDLGLTSVDTLLYKDKSDNSIQLVYFIFINKKTLNQKEYIMSAKNGKIIKSSYTRKTIDAPRTVTLTDLNGKSRVVNSVQNGLTYKFKDITKSMYNSSTGNGFISVEDANFSYGDNMQISEITSTNNLWTPLQVSAQYNASIAYNYFLNVHNRNSIDGNRMNIYAYINVNNSDKGPGYGLPWDQAVYYEGGMYYGNGNSKFKPLAGALDVAGHEMTHGIVDYTAKLDYEYESGAINESMADVFGSMIDSSNWTIGEDIIKDLLNNPSGVLRDLSNPHNGGQPMHMNEFIYGLPNTLEGDYGGVHINSGIPNYAFYLFAKAIGRIKAAKIYYSTLNDHYLTSTSDFQDLRNAVITAASILYGNFEINQAAIAFDSVGIYDGVSSKYDIKLPTNSGTNFLLFNGVGSDTTLYSLKNNTIKILNRGLINSKISVTDNGKIGYFVGKDKKVYSISTDTITNNVVNVVLSNPVWRNLSVSKDGNRLALVSIYQDTTIYLFNINTNILTSYKLYGSTYTGSKLSGPLYADAMDWDYSGQYLVYDCYNIVPSFSGLNDKYYWDINILDIWDSKNNKNGTGNISKVINGTLGINFGNPTFSKKSPNVIAFDYYNQNSNIYSIYGYNLNTSNLNIIAFDNKAWGNPTYNSTDDSVYFSTLNTNNIRYINSIKLNPDKISSPPNAVATPILSNAKFPVSITLGNRAFIVPPTPSITSDRSVNFCNGDSVTLISDSKTTNQWFRNGILIQGVNGSNFVAKMTGNYSVRSIRDSISSEFSPGITVIVKKYDIPPPPVGKDFLYCQNTITDTLRATALIGNSLLWYSTSNIKDSSLKNIPIPSSINLGKTDYYVSQKVNSTGCEGPRLKVSVIIDSIPSAPIVKDISICQGINASPISLIPYNGNSILWYTSNSSSSTSTTTAITPNTANIGNNNFYVSQINNISKCESSKSKFTLTVNPLPTKPTVTSAIICEGQNATITAPSGTFTYTWTVPSGVVTPSISTNSFTTKKAGTYNVTLTNSNGCISEVGSGIVTVNPVPTKPTVTSIFICEGQTGTISTPSGTFTYTWTVPSGVVTPNTSTNSFTTTKPGNYSVTLTNSNGCISEVGSGTATTQPIPNTPIITRDNTGFLISGSTGTTWYKDGIALADTSQKYKPLTPGNYTAKITLNGCSGSISNAYYYLVTDIINLSEDEFIKLSPNPFVGFLNLEFKLKNYQKLNLQVIDVSNGNIVYSLNDIYSGSKLQLSNLSAGIYVVRVKTNDSKKSYQFKMVKY